MFVAIAISVSAAFLVLVVIAVVLTRKDLLIPRLQRPEVEEGAAYIPLGAKTGA